LTNSALAADLIVNVFISFLLSSRYDSKKLLVKDVVAMVNKENLKNVIKSINQGKEYPALKLVQSDPETAALISKLVKPRDPADFNLKNDNSYYNLNQSQIQAISDTLKSRVKDNENIIQLFPDIELAIQILVSSILSPKDMVKTDIIYKAKEPILPSELILKLNTVVENNFENYYNIKNDLQTILRDCLFTVGSYAKIVLPESTVDDIINQNKVVSTESLSSLFTKDSKAVNLGILGNAGTMSNRPALEKFSSYTIPLAYESKIAIEGLPDKYIPNLEISDNYNLLKLPKVIASDTKSKLKQIISSRRVATEDKKISDDQLSALLYKDSKADSKTFVVIPPGRNNKRKSVGRPLVMRIPSESVIPVYIPGNEQNHIGYFVLIDIDGNPVSATSNLEAANGLSGLTSTSNNGSQNQSLSSMLISKARRNLVSSDEQPTIDHITKVYSSIIETDLIQRLNNGLYGSNVAISNNEEIYRIMLARALASKYTRLVFVPSELMTYFAFKYHKNGVGKSYLDDLKVLTSLRAIMLFSKVMAQTKNSIALTHVGITLDPNDPDPQKTIELATHEITKMRQSYFPLGINSPVDLVDWIQRAGFEFSFEGHPGLPQTKFDFETKNLQHILPDNDLDEALRKQTYMALGLSPEVVDNGFNAEFATTVISNNILLSKRIIQLQDIFTVHLSDLCHKIVKNDTIIIDELLEIIKDNKGLIEKTLSDEEKESYNQDSTGFLLDVIDRYVDNISIELPRPDITTVETQTAAFDTYVESLDKTLDAWINSDFMTSDLTGNINSNIDSIKAVVKGYYIRRWMSDNGFMSELNDIVTSDEDGKPTLDIYDLNKNHMEGIIRSSLKFIQSLNPIKIASDKDLEAMSVEEGSGGGDSSSDDSGGGGEGGGDDFGMGGDDMGGDMGMGDVDMGGDGETPEKGEAPAEDEAKEDDVGL
jgi:hypothetical protein